MIIIFLNDDLNDLLMAMIFIHNSCAFFILNYDFIDFLIGYD